MASPDGSLSAALPPALIQAVVHEAALDADRVGLFLRHLGLMSPGNPGKTPPRLPRWFLLGLGAGLRLLVWEDNGTRPHLRVDLPPAMQAIRDLFVALMRQPDQLEDLARELVNHVIRTWVEQMAWDGQASLGGDLVLGEAEEDVLVDALTDFLWTNRHALDGQKGEQP